ncbi:MAG: ATP-binding protein [Methylococcaceae bacterium]
MERSFRVRLAIWVAVLAGVALAGFALIAWQQAYRARFDAVDRSLEQLLAAELSKPKPAEHWSRHALRLYQLLGVDNPDQTLLLMRESGQERFRSAHWPEGIDPATLPWPEPPKNPSPPSRKPATESHPGKPARAVLYGNRLFWRTAGPGRWRFGIAASQHGALVIGIEESAVVSRLDELHMAFLLAAPPVLGFIGFGAWLLAGRALKPIDRLALTMQNLSAQGLHQRVDEHCEDEEFSRLIHVFNGMLERLELSFLQASRFSADAAHELKTPLAVLHGQIEHAISQCEPGSSTQAVFTGLLDEVQHLSTISRKLLWLSLADAGKLNLRKTRVDLSAALNELLEDAQMLAPHLNITGTIKPGLILQADFELLRPLLNNLLSNAIKYNLPHGWLHISTKRIGPIVELSITNASTGIPASERERIFERFYRATPIRGQVTEGVGLGLSLSREIARAHGGDLRLAESTHDAVRFVVVLNLEESR